MGNRGVLLLAAALTGLSLAASAFGHGGVVEEDDACVIKVNYLRAHFKIYQPRTSGHEQFCEDLPAATESVFVMEYMHDALPSMPIDFRIIRDVTGKGRFARLEDIESIPDLEAATVFYKKPMLEPDVYTILHTFEEEGDFIGIVSARNPDSGVVYASVFPFEVGFTGYGYWPIFIGLLVLIQLQYLFMSGRLKRWIQTSAPVVCLLLLAPVAGAQQFTVSYTTPDGPIEINRMHSWILHVEDTSGEPVEGAQIEVDGGMPAHDHGLPTAPRVTEDLGGGDYRLDGVRFHMRGLWQMYFTIRTGDAEETVVISIEL
jgi:hypothetical protein